MKKTVSIKTRIYRLCFVVAVGSALSLGTLYRTQAMSNAVNAAMDHQLQLRAAITSARLGAANYLGTFQAAMLDWENQQQYLDKLKQGREADVNQIQEVASKTARREVKAAMEQSLDFSKALMPIEAEIFGFLNQGDRKAAEKTYKEKYVPAFGKMTGAMEKGREIENSAYEKSAAERERVNANADWAQTAIVILVSVITLLYGFFLARSLSRTLESLGNEITGAADSVRGATTSVFNASQSLSSSTSQLAAAIEETASSMEEMSSMLGQTAQNTSATRTVAEEGQHEAERGKTVITKMVGAMDEIHAANSRLEAIVKLMGEITSKTKVINEIVSETRLLSFNASIEAARAGAHGKGFAVVAEEVGKLATMSGKAAEEIRVLLESSTSEVSSVVRGTQERVSAGKAISQECEVVFSTMNRSLEKIGESIRMIAAATKEQEAGVKQTNQAMSEMDQVTQKNSGSAEALAGQAGLLSSGAAALSESVQQLRGLIFGGHVAEKIRPATATAPSLVPAAAAFEPTADESKKDVSRSDSRWKAA